MTDTPYIRKPTAGERKQPKRCEECCWYGERGGNKLHGFCFTDPHAIKRHATDPACKYAQRREEFDDVRQT